MRLTLKRILLVFVILSVTILLPVLLDQFEFFSAKSSAQLAEWEEQLEELPPPSGGVSPGDTDYTILEIVPYKGLAEMGYLAGGEEPINLELMKWDEVGILSFVNKALNYYKSLQEAPINANGSVNSGWYRGRTTVAQNGYFEWVGWNNGGNYNYTGNVSYAYVGSGRGRYKAVLSSESTNDPYSSDNIMIHLKNVKAKFVYGTASGKPLYNNTRYKLELVTRNTGHGEYDYNCETNIFSYNNTHTGDYDVIFKSGSGDYYMLADYTIVTDNSGNYSWNLSYQDVGTNNGDYTKIDVDFQYQQWGGPYKWVQSNTVSDTVRIVKDSSNTITRAEIRGQMITVDYQFTKGITLVNNEWLKRYILGIPANQVKNYNVDVITVTPEELNQASGAALIQNADLFYINSMKHNDYYRIYEKYTYSGRAETRKYDSYSSDYNFARHDISWERTEAIFKRLAGVGGARASVLFDAKAYDDGKGTSGYYKMLPLSEFPDVVGQDYQTYNREATICNVSKLYLMVYERDIVSFYNAFMNPNTTGPYKITRMDTTANSSGSTGVFVRPDQIQAGLTGTQFTNAYNTAKNKDVAKYWNQITFVPYKYDRLTNGLVKIATTTEVYSEIKNINLLNYRTDVHENVLIINSQEIFGNAFVLEPSGLGTNDNLYRQAPQLALNTYNENNGTSQTTLTIANLVNVITNGGDGYNSDGRYPSVDEGGTGPGDGQEGSNLRSFISVLNIQPTADFTASVDNINRILDGYRVKIDNMTSTQLNGSMMDLNTHYDLIYMGCGIGRFNLVSGKTVFNNAAYNNSVYLSLGDKVNLSGGTKNYAGNDITSQKLGELKKFLTAGYPIILEDDLYHKINISNTNAYTLMNEITASANASTYKNVIKLSNLLNNETASKFKLLSGLGVIRPQIDLEAPTIPADAGVNYQYAPGNRLTVQFMLQPSGRLPNSYVYDAYLYLDLDGDGIFGSSERIEVESVDGSRPWEGISENTATRLSHKIFRYSMDALNGVYQWKILVKRQDNAEIRSEVTGYVAVTNKQDIRVLQIIDNPSGGISEYSLASKVNDTASLIKKYAGYDDRYQIRDYNIIFETKTVDQFKALYEAQAYDNSSAEAKSATDKLSNYHLIILDNQVDQIPNTRGAVNNIKDEITNTLNPAGVIFTRDAINFSKQSNYLINPLFLNLQTYNYLNRRSLMGGSYQYYSHSKLNMPGRDLTREETYHTTYATRSNRGAIGEYPYKIGTFLSIAWTSYPEDVTRDFGLAPADGAALTGWFTLSDNQSPIVNSTVTPENLYQGLYSTSPEDVKNNYYLINRSHTYYSGINLKNADTLNNDEEIKLFVNTIIAAFKDSGRVVATRPRIVVTDPSVIPGGVISVTPDMLTGDELEIEFKIENSSSNSAFTVVWPDAIPTGGWNTTVYQGANPVNLGSSNYNIVRDTVYTIRIPKADITETPRQVILKARNGQALEDTYSFSVVMALDRPVVTVENLINDAYLYVNIDYPDSAGNTAREEEIKVEFSVSGVTNSVLVNLVSDSIIINNISYYLSPMTQNSEGQWVEIPGTTYALGVSVPPGRYLLHIPEGAGLLHGVVTRTISIEASLAVSPGNKGSDDVILLRRGLFPLE